MHKPTLILGSIIVIIIFIVLGLMRTADATTKCNDNTIKLVWMNAWQGSRKELKKHMPDAKLELNMSKVFRSRLEVPVRGKSGRTKKQDVIIYQAEGRVYVPSLPASDAEYFTMEAIHYADTCILIGEPTEWDGWRISG